MRTARPSGLTSATVVVMSALAWAAGFIGQTALAEEHTATYQTSPGAQEFGTPYAIWGSPQNPGFWEQYRKYDYVTGWGTDPDPIMHTTMSATSEKFGLLRQGSGAGKTAVIAPGLFVGPSGLTAIPTSERLALVGLQTASGNKGIDVRVGFVENFASGGGAGFAAGITANGGDNGFMDLFTGGWGVDGVEIHFEINGSGANWSVPAPGNVRATLFGATSTQQEHLRYNYKDSVSSVGSLSRSTTLPLYVAWEATTGGGDITFKVGWGDQDATNIVYTWTFADNLHQAGDDELQNNFFDVANVAPVFFTGWGTWEPSADTTAEETLAIHGAAASPDSTLLIVR